MITLSRHVPALSTGLGFYHLRRYDDVGARRLSTNMEKRENNETIPELRFRYETAKNTTGLHQPNTAGSLPDRELELN